MTQPECTRPTTPRWHYRGWLCDYLGVTEDEESRVLEHIKPEVLLHWSALDMESEMDWYPYKEPYEVFKRKYPNAQPVFFNRI